MSCASLAKNESVKRENRTFSSNNESLHLFELVFTVHKGLLYFILFFLQIVTRSCSRESTSNKSNEATKFDHRSLPTFHLVRDQEIIHILAASALVVGNVKLTLKPNLP